MPKKKYDDEVLREKALELRRLGYSYREIAKILGCSVYKVYTLISDYENPRSRIKQVMELADKVEELKHKVNELSELVEKFKANVKDVEVLGKLNELVSMVNGLNEELRSVRSDLKVLREIVSRVEDYLDLIRRGCIVKARTCKWCSSDGYCLFWYWDKRIEKWDMKPDTLRDRKVYRLNVLKNPLLCSACPIYEPKHKRQGSYGW